MRGRQLILRAVATCALGLASVAASAHGLPGTKPVELAPGVTLEITELRRMADKDAVELKFVVANATPGPVSASKLGFATGFRLDEIQLIDFANKRSYAMGGGSRCLCSTFTEGGEVQPGKRREFWAWFGQPQAGVQTLSLQIGGQPPITDIPLR